MFTAGNSRSAFRAVSQHPKALLVALGILAAPGHATAQKPPPGTGARIASPSFQWEAPASVAASLVAESESNNTIATADPVTLGEEAAGEVNPSADVDYYRFTAQEGTTVVLSVRASEVGSPLDPTLELIAPDGVTSLAFNDDFTGLDSRIVFSVTATGQYYVAIAGFLGQGGPGHFYTIDFDVLEPGPGDPTELFSTGFDGPFGLAFDQTGHLFVAELFADRISRIGPNGTATVFVSGIGGPVGLAFDRAGNLLVAGSRDGTIHRVSPAGTRTPLITGLELPWDVAVTPEGDIWVGDVGSQMLRRYDANGALQESFDVTSVGGPEFHLAFSPSGDLYFSNGLDTVYRLVDGHLQLFVQSELYIEGLAFDVDGYLYVANGFLGKIVLFAPDGSVVEDPLALTNIGGPTDLAFGRDADGSTNSRLFASNLGFNLEPPFAGGIVEMNPMGIRAPGWPVILPAIAIAPSELPDGVVGAEYHATLASPDESVSPTWSIAEGALPTGVGLDPVTGVLSGILQEAGTFEFDVRASDSPRIGRRSYSVTIADPVLALGSVTDQVLGATGVLTEAQIRFLDLIGNRNGRLDIGDLRAFLIHGGFLQAPPRQPDPSAERRSP